jgi:hypothetical protein
MGRQRTFQRRFERGAKCIELGGAQTVLRLFLSTSAARWSIDFTSGDIQNQTFLTQHTGNGGGRRFCWRDDIVFGITTPVHQRRPCSMGEWLRMQ